MGNISKITKVAHFYKKNNGFNATVTVEDKEKTCIIDGHGTNNIKILIVDFKFQVEEFQVEEFQVEEFQVEEEVDESIAL